MSRPSRTFGPLHFEDLEPHRFEDLVRQLVHDFRQWKEVEATGRTGSDEGMDIRAIEAATPVDTVYPHDVSREESDTVRDTGSRDRVWVIQCKREAKIGPKRVREIVCDNLSNLRERVHGYILVAACDFSKSARDAFKDECVKYGLGEYYIWGKAEVEDQLVLPKNNRLLFTYFGISLRESEGTSLTETLTRMHDRMINLKDIRLEQRFAKKRFEDACPLFFSRLGIIGASEWSGFERKVAKRVKHNVPRSPEKKGTVLWRYRVIEEAQDIVKDLVSSKEWQIEDLVSAAAHLDSINMGVGELRDKDEQWQDLLKEVRSYATDPILRELIDSHMAHSYAFCSVLLMIGYGRKLSKHAFGRMLCSALTSSNISPSRMQVALGEILEKVSNRLKRLAEAQE